MLETPTDKNATRMTPLRLLTSDADLADDSPSQETAKPGFLAPPHVGIPLPSPTASAKIRFAPLPEIRPRSYSTGNSLFLEDGDINDPDRNWVRRESNQVQFPDSALGSDDEMDDDENAFGRRSSGELSRGREARMRQAATANRDSENLFSKDRWRMEGQVVGKSSAPSTPSGEKDGMMGAMLNSISNRGEASITLKILRPLSFGLVKKKKKSKRSSMSESAAKGDKFPRYDSMDSNTSRVSSASAVSGYSAVSGVSGVSGTSSVRRAATAAGSSYAGNGERTWGSEGGALMRSADDDDDDAISGSGRRNWEQSAAHSGPSVNSHQYAPSRRANYPPVAQRSKKKPKPATAPTFSKVVEPKFVEWGFERAGSAGGGLGNNRKNGINVDEDEEEDGSGLAWIKRRKEERRIKAEEAEMKKIAEEVREAQEAQRLLQGAGQLDHATPTIRLIPESPSAVEPAIGFASLQEAVHRLGADPTLANPDASVSATSLVTSSGPPSDTRSEGSVSPSDEVPNPLLGSAHSNASAPTSPVSLVASLPLLTTTPVVIPPVPSRSVAPHIRKSSTSPAGRKESGESEELDEVDAASDSSSSSSDSDSDLDEEELAIEESMKEKARITALSAGTLRSSRAVSLELMSFRLQRPRNIRIEVIRTSSRACDPCRFPPPLPFLLLSPIPLPHRPLRDSSRNLFFGKRQDLFLSIYVVPCTPFIHSRQWESEILVAGGRALSLCYFFIRLFL